MLTAFRVAMALIALYVSAVLANAQSLPKEAPARTEIFPIPSLTLSDQQFLSGDAAAGKPVTVAGEFRVAQGTGAVSSSTRMSAAIPQRPRSRARP